MTDEIPPSPPARFRAGTDSALATMEVLALDCQTTGTRPPKASVLELAWAPTQAQAPATEEALRAELVRLKPGRRVPRKVAQLTGITTAMLADAAPPRAVWEALLSEAEADAPGRAVVVVHYARFERAFLEAWREAFGTREALPFELICTHAIARRLLPGLPRCGLRALAGYLGHGTPALKRAGEHALATAAIWGGLVERLEAQEGVRTLGDLRVWLGTKRAKRPRKLAYPVARDARLALPKEPGVYRMRDVRDAVLYVGKATSLHARVNSYFQKRTKRSERILELLTRAHRVEATPCGSPLEAALMETDAIKAHDPPYNIALKADGRVLGFATPDLRDVRDAPSALHTVGPLPSREAVASLAGLAEALEEGGGHRWTPRRMAWALRVPQRHTPEPVVCAAAWARFMHKHHARLTQTRDPVAALLALGAELWLLQRAAAGAESDDADDTRTADSAAEAQPRRIRWTTEGVVTAFEASVCDAARMVRRASVLTQLTHAAVVWRPTHAEDAPLRALVLERGAVVDTREGDAAARVSAPRPPGARLACLEGFDVAMYDRLRVLTSELRRVVQRAPEVQVQRGAGAVWSKAQLERVLGWV